jgi:hypothetical protein
MAIYDRLTAFCRTRGVYLLFFLLPLFIYYPLFHPDTVLLGGTDLLFGHYPGLLYGHHMVRAGDLGLWNRLIYDGRDFSQSLLNHILYPLNWPTLLVPDRYVLRFISWQLFIEICACGCLAYVIAGLFLADPWARLLVAVTTELGGFMWFNVTTFIGVHLTFVTLIAAYLLLSSDRRRPLATFVALSFSFAGVMLIGHPGYLTGCGLSLIGVFVGKFLTLPSGRSKKIYGATVIAAGIAALVLSAFRIVPVFTQLSQESAVANWFPDYQNGLYYLLSGVIPGAFGLDVSESSRILTFFGGEGRNNQFHTMHYFGVAAFFLGYLGISGKAGRRAQIMALVALFLVLTSVAVTPVSDFFYLAFWPITHEAMAKYTCYFAILATMVFTLHAIETDRLQRADKDLRIFLLVTTGVLAAFIAFLANIFYHIPGPHWGAIEGALKLLLLGTLAFGIAIAVSRLAPAAFFGRLTASSHVLFVAIAAGTAYFAWRSPKFPHHYLVLKTLSSDIGAIASAVAVVYAARLLGARWPAALPNRIVFGLSAGIAAVLLCVPLGENHVARSGLGEALFTAIWSAAVFFVLSCSVAELFARHSDRRLLLCFLTVLTVCDLLFFDRVNEYVNGSPFVALNQMYPDTQRLDQDYDRASWEAAGSQAELLTHPDLAMTDSTVIGWVKGGASGAAQAADSRAGAVRLVNRGDDLASLSQDLLPNPTVTAVSFGAWVRADGAARPEILLSGGARGGGPRGYGGDGRWQWISVTADRPNGGWASVRPTLGVLGLGSAEFYAPHLVAGPYVKPSVSPGGDITPSASLAGAERYGGDDDLDIEQYRINNPSYLVSWAPIMSDVPMIYGLPTYGGEDSDVPADFVNFLQAFDPDPGQLRWYQRAGIATAIRNDRLLDLLGVRYDVLPTYVPHSDKGIVQRPNALARFSLFRHFEVIADKSAALDRLKDPAFDPTKTAIVDRDPDSADGAAARFAPMPYEAARSELLHLSYDEASPAVLLFDDTYSPLWHAEVDGKALPVYHGNVNFMAVSLPSGRHRLTLSFEPLQFYRLAGISIGGAILLLLLGGYLAVSAGLSGRRRSPGPAHAAGRTP